MSDYSTTTGRLLDYITPELSFVRASIHPHVQAVSRVAAASDDEQVPSTRPGRLERGAAIKGQSKPGSNGKINGREQHGGRIG